MAEPIRTLSDDDIRILREMVNAHRNRGVTETVSRSIRPVPDPQSPDVYIARAPEGGIPGIDENTTGTGSPGWMDDIPGSASCEIYKLSPANGIQTLKRLGWYKTVYNFGPAITGSKLLIIVRDKFGTWVATNLLGLDYAEC